jgi:hypothetical protein
MGNDNKVLGMDEERMYKMDCLIGQIIAEMQSGGVGIVDKAGKTTEFKDFGITEDQLAAIISFVCIYISHLNNDETAHIFIGMDIAQITASLMGGVQ